MISFRRRGRSLGLFILSRNSAIPYQLCGPLVSRRCARPVAGTCKPVLTPCGGPRRPAATRHNWPVLSLGCPASPRWSRMPRRRQTRPARAESPTISDASASTVRCRPVRTCRRRRRVRSSAIAPRHCSGLVAASSARRASLLSRCCPPESSSTCRPWYEPTSTAISLSRSSPPRATTRCAYFAPFRALTRRTGRMTAHTSSRRSIHAPADPVRQRSRRTGSRPLARSASAGCWYPTISRWRLLRRHIGASAPPAALAPGATCAPIATADSNDMPPCVAAAGPLCGTTPPTRVRCGRGASRRAWPLRSGPV